MPWFPTSLFELFEGVTHPCVVGIALPETNIETITLKIGNPKKEMNHLPTIDFQG